jgi:hypothetical protein
MSGSAKTLVFWIGNPPHHDCSVAGSGKSKFL